MPDPATTQQDSIIRSVLDCAAVRARGQHGWEPIEKHTPFDALLEAEVSAEAVGRILASCSALKGEAFDQVKSALTELLTEEPEADARIRQEAFHRLLGFIFQRGPHPSHVLQRTFSLAKSFVPELLVHMNMRDLAKICDDTPAAWSWRIEQAISKRIGAAGMRGTRLSFQKNEESRQSFSAAQKGNKNRKAKPGRARLPLPVIPSADSIE